MFWFKAITKLFWDVFVLKNYFYKAINNDYKKIIKFRKIT